MAKLSRSVSASSFLPARVRALRLSRGLSIRALAQKSGVSSSMISSLEGGVKSPTIALLSELATAFRISVSEMLAEPNKSLPLALARDARSRALVDRHGIRRSNLSAALKGAKVQFVLLCIPPGKSTGAIAGHGRRTIEHVFLESGRLRIVVGDDSNALEAGDSISFRAHHRHTFINVGRTMVNAYCVVEAEIPVQ
jgi:transcriptional regulator with XRE-family HTH domain